MKQVRETAAFKSISAYYIYNPKTGQRAQVEAHWSNSGVCRVDVWQFDGSGLIHQGRAGGYGYDKFTAALRGAKIFGIEIYDHCEKKRDDGQYEQAGLDRLRQFGFEVVQVI